MRDDDEEVGKGASRTKNEEKIILFITTAFKKSPSSGVLTDAIGSEVVEGIHVDYFTVTGPTE